MNKKVLAGSKFAQCGQLLGPDVSARAARFSVHGCFFGDAIQMCLAAARGANHPSAIPLPRDCAAGASDLLRKSDHDVYSGSEPITTHPDHISHCKTAPDTNRSKRWT